MPPKKDVRLTAFYCYLDAKTEELKQAGRIRVTTNEVVEYWNALNDKDKKPWEEKAAAACAAYFNECTERALEDGGEEEEDGEEEGDAGDGEGEDDEDENDSTPALPLSRVKRIIRLSAESQMSKEATFAIGKATETFLERCVWEAARVTHREGRKTISFKDLVNSMRQHPIPEALQFFVGAPPTLAGPGFWWGISLSLAPPLTPT